MIGMPPFEGWGLPEWMVPAGPWDFGGLLTGVLGATSGMGRNWLSADLMPAGPWCWIEGR